VNVFVASVLYGPDAGRALACALIFAGLLAVAGALRFHAAGRPRIDRMSNNNPRRLNARLDGGARSR